MAATVWKGYLSFGLVSFPIRLFAAARAETVHFHMLHKKDLSRVREVLYCAEEDIPIERADIVKGYEYEKNKYVVVEQEELDQAAPATASAMEILQFVRMEEIDPVYLETSYYVAPEEAVSKPYALLLSAMKQTGYDAVAKVTMHQREHIVILRPTEKGMMLHTMYFVDELHEGNQTFNAGEQKFDKKEIELAKQLINSLASAFHPEQYEDEYRKNVEKLIASKRNGKKVIPIRQPSAPPVMDLMKALQQSLAKTKGTATASKSSKTKAVKTTATKKAVRKGSTRVA
jgi:DNA end-binding protein Ku